MSYCRFENTHEDFVDCLDALNEISSLNNLSENEQSAALKMYKVAQQYIERYEELNPEVCQD